MYQRRLSRNQISMIHIAKNQIGMSDIEYRDMLLRFGVTSSKFLNAGQWDDVYQYLCNCGFIPSHKSARKSGMHKKPARSRQFLVSKVKALLTDMDLPWGYVDELSRRICKVDRFRFVPKNEIYKIITALRKQKEHKEKPKALSFCQPWAYAILHMGKRIENRSRIRWVRGEFYIHASKKFDQAGYEWISENIGSLPSRKDFDYGGIVGIANIVDCVESSDDIWFKGPYGLVLDEVSPLDFVPCSGRQGMWVVPEDVIKKVWEVTQ